MSPRIYYSGPFSLTMPQSLDSRGAHHVRVLRLQTGDLLTLFNGIDQLAQARIEQLDKKQVQVRLLQIDNALPLLVRPLHLVQGLIRSDKMDWIIQKAVELGVTEITPVICERTQGRLKPTQWEAKCLHWQEIIMSAGEQSGNNCLPTLHAPRLFSDFLGQHSSQPVSTFILDPQATQTFHDFTAPTSSTEIRILIGPEGGFTSTELSLAAYSGSLSICIHPHILRAETAAIAALTQCQFHFNAKESIISPLNHPS